MNCNKEIQQKSCCEPVYVFEDASNFYTKQEVDDLIEGISGVTSGDVETMIEEAIEPLETELENKTSSGDVITILQNSIWVENGILHIGEERH